MKKEEIDYLYRFYPNGAFEYFLKLFQERSKFLNLPYTEEQIEKALFEGYYITGQTVASSFPLVIGSQVEISIEDVNFYSRAKEAVRKYLENRKIWDECCFLIHLTCFDKYLTVKRKQEPFFEFVSKSSRVLNLIQRIENGDFDEAIIFWVRSNITE